MRCRIHAAWPLLLFVLIELSVLHAQTFPKSTGRVNDFANVLSPSARVDLDSLLQSLEDETTAEVAVATVTSLEGISIEEYANKLFREWGVGQVELDNGVLVLVVPSERQMRIEVGYGLVALFHRSNIAFVPLALAVAVLVWGYRRRSSLLLVKARTRNTDRWDWEAASQGWSSGSSSSDSNGGSSSDFGGGSSGGAGASGSW